MQRPCTAVDFICELVATTGEAKGNTRNLVLEHVLFQSVAKTLLSMAAGFRQKTNWQTSFPALTPLKIACCNSLNAQVPMTIISNTSHSGQHWWPCWHIIHKSITKQVNKPSSGNCKAIHAKSKPERYPEGCADPTRAEHIGSPEEDA